MAYLYQLVSVNFNDTSLINFMKILIIKSNFQKNKLRKRIFSL